MNQHQAPLGTVATLGHPANLILIVKGEYCWRYVNSGVGVDDIDFRAGWDFYEPATHDGPRRTVDAPAVHGGGRVVAE